MRICINKIKTRIKSYELRLQAIRSQTGPIDPRDAEAEKYLQEQVNNDNETVLKYKQQKKGV